MHTYIVHVQCACRYLIHVHVALSSPSPSPSPLHPPPHPSLTLTLSFSPSPPLPLSSLPSEVLLVTKTREERRKWMEVIQDQNPQLLKTQHSDTPEVPRKVLSPDTPKDKQLSGIYMYVCHCAQYALLVLFPEFFSQKGVWE